MRREPPHRERSHRIEDAVVAHEVEARGRDEGGELLDELERVEDDVARAVAPAVLQAVEEPSIRQAREATPSEAFARAVAMTD
jgi:hypothetical protein